MSDMLVKLYELPELTPLIRKIKKEIEIRQAMTYEKYKIIEWIEQTFGTGWAGECETAFSRQPVSCFIAVKNGRIIGFACHDCTCKNFLGPIGVEKDFRGAGAGTAPVVSCLYAMKATGYAYAIIGGVESVDFYTRTINAIVIEGSSPGIYPGPLNR